MRRFSLLFLSVLLSTSTSAVSQDRLSKDWKQNKLQPHTIYYTTDVMPAGSELRIRVVECGNADILLYDTHDGGVSPSVYRFKGISAGQVLKYKLPRAMNIGIAVGSPAQANCVGVEDKGQSHLLKYDFGNLGKFVLESKVVGEPF